MKRTMRILWLAGSILILSLAFLGTGAAANPPSATPYPLGDVPLDRATYDAYLQTYPEGAVAALPAAYDARSSGWVTPAKNQGSCGSCWAFAATGAMESHLLKAGLPYDPTDLSEQQQNSCNTSQNGCCGGSSTAMRFWETRGPVYETCFPYGDGSTGCPPNSSVPCSNGSGCQQLPYRVTGWHTVSATTDQFKASLYTYGPSYWRYYVYTDFDTYWSSGAPGQVYTSKSGATLRGGHAVLLIGWDDSKGAFLCKNSWGTDGGPNDDGTFWIAYTGHYNNLGFGMANFSVVNTSACGDGVCGGVAEGETCNTCPVDCPDGSGGGSCSACFKGKCDGFCNTVKEGPDCADCAPTWCCGDGTCGTGETNALCPVDCPVPVCGDGTCQAGESACDCPEDCGTHPEVETLCNNGLDDDCDGYFDCADSDCDLLPPCNCEPKGAICTANSQCCSSKCLRGFCR